MDWLLHFRLGDFHERLQVDQRVPVHLQIVVDLYVLPLYLTGRNWEILIEI